MENLEELFYELCDCHTVLMAGSEVTIRDIKTCLAGLNDGLSLEQLRERLRHIVQFLEHLEVSAYKAHKKTSLIQHRLESALNQEAGAPSH